MAFHHSHKLQPAQSHAGPRERPWQSSAAALSRAKEINTEQELTGANLPNSFPKLNGVPTLCGVLTVTGKEKKKKFTVVN